MSQGGEGDDGTAEAEGTRARLTRAAVEVFSTSGYESVSVREIERRAATNRGLVAYHFGSKEGVWKAAIDWLMLRFREEMAQYQHVMRDVSAPERSRVLLKVALRFHAKNPEYLRMLVLHGGEMSDRLEWLVDHHLRRNLDFFHRVSGDGIDYDSQADAISHYLFNGAALIFAVQSQCQLMFGFDPTDEAFLERYVSVITDLFRPAIGADGITDRLHELAGRSKGEDVVAAT